MYCCHRSPLSLYLCNMVMRIKIYTLRLKDKLLSNYFIQIHILQLSVHVLTLVQMYVVKIKMLPIYTLYIQVLKLIFVFCNICRENLN